MTVARFTLVPAFSRRWWALWAAKALAGESTKAMVDSARRGRPWQARPETVPSDVGLVAVAVGSSAFDAWRTWFAMRGVTFPTPSKAPVVFLPSPEPPEDRRHAA